MSNRYSNIKISTSETGKKYYLNAIYPEIELDEDDIYAITVDGDRYDKLALQFYYDASYWWIIAAANDLQESDSIVLTPGTQVRIPAHPEQYIRAFEELNS